MFSDATTYCKTCEVCQCTKINYSHYYLPLHLHTLPDEIGTHLVLARTTAERNIAVLVVVEAFSGYPYLTPVKDKTAVTTAKALITLLSGELEVGHCIQTKVLVLSMLCSDTSMLC